MKGIGNVKSLYNIIINYTSHYFINNINILHHNLKIIIENIGFFIILFFCYFYFYQYIL